MFEIMNKNINLELISALLSGLGNQMINGIMMIDVVTENRNDHEIK
jgi:hypothetical protein